LIILSFLAAAATRQQINLLVILSGFMAGPLFLNIWYAGGMLNGLSVRRRLPKLLEAGQTLSVQVEAANERRRTAWSLVVTDCVQRDGAEKSEPPLRPATTFSHLASQETQTVRYSGKLTRRGRYRFGPLRTSTRFPFGLVEYFRESPAADELIVYPRLGRLVGFWGRLRRRAGTESARPRSSLLGASGDFHNLRDWQSGDNLRWIHWRTTARLDKLMVRQFEREQSRDFVLLLNLRLPAEPTALDRERIEAAVSFAATVCRERCHQGGGLMWLGVAGTEVQVHRGMVSPATFHSFMRTLATVQAAQEDRLGELLAESPPFRNADVAVITSMELGDLSSNKNNENGGNGKNNESGNLSREALVLNAGRGDLDAYFLPS
ncbi:MAG: DUF58 domain-containing protein, partial [Planctomycetales bacterium]